MATLIIARLTDLLRGHIKKTSLGLLSLASVAYTGLSLVSTGALTPPSYVSLEASVFSLLVVGNCFVGSTGPLLQVKRLSQREKFSVINKNPRSCLSIYSVLCTILSAGIALILYSLTIDQQLS